MTYPMEDWSGGLPSWTRYGYAYTMVLDHRPEWVELRYPHGEGWSIRVERGDGV